MCIRDRTCVNYKAGLEIVCHIGRFEDLKPAGQYQLVHHEYAVLAGLEPGDGSSSSYQLSSQLADYLRYETVLRLGPDRVADSKYLNFCGDGYLGVLIAKEFKSACNKVSRKAVEELERFSLAEEEIDVIPGGVFSKFLSLKKLAIYDSNCLLYTSPSPRDATLSRMPSSA